MSTPAPTVSNPVTVTVAAPPPSIVLTVAPTELPSAGGSLAFSATTVGLADGTALRLLQSVDGGDTYQDTGTTATVASNAASCSFTVPTNTGSAAETLMYELST